MTNPNENWVARHLGEGWKRQSLHGYRIFDFWNHSKGVAVEVDGPEHDRGYDNYRDEYNFRRSGIIVLRLRNQNESDLKSVLDVIHRIGDHKERKHCMGIMGNSKKAKRTLSEQPYLTDKHMFVDYLLQMDHRPYWMENKQ